MPVREIRAMGKYFFLIVSAFCSLAQAAKPQVVETIKTKANGEDIGSSVSTYYCGLHCVYAAAEILDSPFEFEKIISADRVSGRYGSTAGDLVDTLEDVGLHGSYHSFYSVDRLRLAKYPVILHVRPLVVPGNYTHWVLFLGFDGEKVRIYDPPHDQAELTLAELQSIWDGAAIEVVKNQPEDKSFIFQIPSVSTISIIFIAIGMIYLLSHKLSASLNLIGTTLTIVCIVHVISAQGFLFNPLAIRNVSSSYFPVDIPRLSLDQVKQRIQQKKVVLVDARTMKAYQKYHLPSAVPVPIDSNYSQIVQACEQLADSQEVIVYCQSDQCGWAMQVASQLQLRHGKNNVSVYHGGVNDWVSEANDK